MIAGTGAATTISVQRLGQLELPTSEDNAAATAAAGALARLRDAQSAAVGQSELVAGSAVYDGSALSFEFVTPLVSIGTSADEVSPSLKRHTVARAVKSKDGSGGGLVLWAGARESYWQAGAGDSLRAAAATFGVPGGGSVAPPEPQRTVPSNSNAHYGPGWAAAPWD